ncbi:dynamin family protein [Bacillus sp. RAR_GA_16]|uniref:dynamin family protein n=1 Tax=Bacillus sp. RAR_GA_16 TaxID=2876774 RepID=UPI001CCAB27A|nr:dynamin family protein [Bacillus sp. RAR_GA_16]MCA0174198.1 dynamin family protein [Bacillus sp. RAR_GA_16]
MKHNHQSKTKVKEDALLERLALIETKVTPSEASKIKQLRDKLKSGEQHFLFSGHFSAGKSSLINALFETNLLPSSPIPASANTVRIRSGEAGAAVHFINGKKMVFKAPYDIDQIKGYCLNGEEVERVELSAPSSIEENVIFIDTPGIDSTDEAHRLSTESSMYLADVVFYVMDYNHVQSEVNYQFIRELYRQNKKIILIVNQIDKHKEDEISFNAFKKSVVESFETWGMSLESFFFISLRDHQHPHNQFHQLKTYIEGLSKKTAEDKMKRVTNAAIELINNMDTVIEDQEVMQAYEVMEKKRSFSEERIKLIEEEFQSEASSIQKSAILMPYEVREAGRDYLESLQPGFKVGLVFRDKKTQQERSNRYASFVSGLEEQVKSQLEWHYQELLKQLISTAALTKVEPPVLDEPFQLDFTAIQEEAKKGNGATGEAVLHYTENVAHSMKMQIKQQAEKRKNRLVEQVNLEHKQIASEVQASFKEQVGEKESEKLLAEMETISEKTTELMSILQGDRDEEASAVQKSRRENEESEEVIIVEPVKGIHSKDESEESPFDEEVVEKKGAELPDSESTAQALQKLATELTDLPGFLHTKQNLIKKARKLTEKSYTVALFGAFSAGKSSFANALIGEKILPSSPNPTTATLNRICPVTEKHAHKTAMIHYKTEEELLEDLNHSLSFFGEQAFSLRDCLQMISAGKLFKRESAETKPHALFLRAVLKGEGELSYLGIKREVTLEEYEDMVVNEAKAAFIASISLYYDCALTREGITLVDTPGADSINARHTGVAFQYMKAADAILYVTYYNHAFSKADREFLIQLGRVKDVFEMDKMFFLLNASDLAENDHELRTVLDHVKKQLQQYGIRYPALYPVSSLAGMLPSHSLSEKESDFLSNLPKKIKNKGGLASFEERFYRFIQTDLSKMAVEASISEINRVKAEIDGWIENYELNANEKEEQLARLQRKSDEAISEVEGYTASSSVKQIEQELTELVHYMPQRLFYRFNDFFKEAFNPSMIQNREGLYDASKSLLEDITQDLLQELRAASLRIDRFISRELQKNEKEMQLAIRNYLSDFRYSLNDSMEMATPAFTASLSSWISSETIQKLARSSFKSPKQFFEQNGRDDLHDGLKKEFQQPVSDYLTAEKQVIETVATNFYEENLHDMKQEIQKEIKEYIETRKTMFNSELSKDFLLTKQGNVAKIQTNLLGE